MKDNKLILLLIFFLISSCSFDKSTLYPEVENGYGSGEAYIIYSTILDSEKNNYSNVFVLSDSTVTYELSNASLLIDYLKLRMPSLTDETINHYQISNKKSIQLENIPYLEIECHLIPKNERMSWRTKYPDAAALFYFSRIGFNSKNNQALVYFSHYSAPLGASGNFFF